MSALVSQITAYITILPPGAGVVRFPYNPESITIQKSASWQSTPQAAEVSGTPQFQGSMPQSMSINILLDTFAIPPNPPQVAIDILQQALVPNPANTVAGDAKPPTVMFGWGTNIVMEEAYIKSMSITYKRFLLGQAIRAEVAVNLEEVPLSLPGTNPTSGAVASRRTHTVIEGDSLASIAFAEYNSPNRWRAIAEVNGIDDPMRVPPGTELLLPDPFEASSLS
jgi:nucleoid-associated protein YgaU